MNYQQLLPAATMAAPWAVASTNAAAAGYVSGVAQKFTGNYSFQRRATPLVKTTPQ